MEENKNKLALKLIENIRDQNELCDNFATVIGGDPENMYQILSNTIEIFLDYIGVPENDFNEETISGFCRDWWCNLLYNTTKENNSTSILKECLDSLDEYQKEKDNGIF
jgi:hypothetical protein